MEEKKYKSSFNQHKAALWDSFNKYDENDAAGQLPLCSK